MRLPRYWWFARFAQLGLLLALALTVSMGIGCALWYPTSHLLFADGWQWMPFDKWLRYVLICIPIGLGIGFVFTTYEWWQSRK